MKFPTTLPKEEMNQNPSEQKIFATGVSGTIGRHLSELVLPIEHNLLELPTELPQISGGVLIHLASQVGPVLVERNPEKSKKINVDGTINLAKLAIDGKCSRFVFISTSHVYAPSNERITEENEITPINLYAEQKYKTELELRNLFEGTSSTKLLIIRLFSVIGLNMKSFTLGGAISRILAGDSDLKITNASDIRDFVAPETAAKAIESISKDMKVEETVLNLCTGVGLSVREATGLVVKQKGRELPVNSFKDGNSPNPYIVGNPSLLNKYLEIPPLYFK
jgi:nucleoside-diphosphate-sugar epimerase